MKFKIKNAALFLFVACMTGQISWAQTANFHVVPLPKEVKATQAGNFEISSKTAIVYTKGDKDLKRYAEFLSEYIKEATGLQLTVSNAPFQRNCIRLTASMKNENPEAYTIRANSDIILLDGATAAGTFYAVQTLRKALPQGRTNKVIVPATEVTDYPRFSYRGAHLDVSRHFINADSVRRFIDMIALHNINRMHWHLTDDQGWRVEIKKYPKLTEIGSKRAQTVIGHNSGKYDGIPYGGFYTQKEIKEIVKYAQERNITIIPEIDMPGHMLAALAAYPEMGCTGGPYKVWEIWGVSSDVLCAANPKTYQFIDDVLDEIAKLFPSKYIHVGGDECPKDQWKKCQKCQNFIKEHNLQGDGKHTSEERLQSYVINHAEKHLNSLGRQMIGWDETLEGGLAPNATVMSWRGEAGGIEAAKQHHDVIMTPNTYLYFDYYQSSDVKNEPEAIGGYLPIERVYSYEPMPSSLTPEEQKYIIGVQANCWTEYMKTYKQVEYMELPRMAALSEIQWCSSEQKDFSAFMQRLPRLISVYRTKQYNFSKVIYNVSMKLTTDTVNHAIIATLSTLDNAEIHYTLDGLEPTTSSARYTNPIKITQSATLRVAAFRNGEKGREVSQSFEFNKATAHPIKLLQPSNRDYTYTGETLLVDGIKGESTNYRTGHWMGFNGTDLEAIIDLNSPTNIEEVALQTCVEKGDWIFGARSFKVEASIDGINYTQLASKDYPAMQENDPNQRYPLSLKFSPTSARYLKVTVTSEHNTPAWHGNKGNPSFLFVDEIVVK